METWIKVRTALHEDPKVVRMAQHIVGDSDFVEWAYNATAYDRVAHDPDNALEFMSFPAALRCVTSGVTQVWAAANQHGKSNGNDVILNATTRYGLDVLAGVPGITKAMEGVGWAIVNEEEETITFPKFMTYNVPLEDRKRKQAAERQDRFRKKHQRHESVTSSVTSALQSRVTVTPSEIEIDDDEEEETNKEEEGIGPAGPVCVPENGVKQDGAKPFDRWNALAARFGLRKLGKWTPARQKALGSRLREHPDFWERVEAELPRLGRFAREKGFVDFDFLCRPSKLEPFLEGKHRDHATVQAVDTTRPQVRELLKHVGRQVEADLGAGQKLKYTLLSAGLMHDHDRSVCFYAKLPDDALDRVLAALEKPEA